MAVWLGLFGAGVLTFASPCILPLIPVYLSTLVGGLATGPGADPRLKLRLVVRTLAFSAGFLAVFVLFGLSASWLGGLLADHRLLVSVAAASLLLLFGIHMLHLVEIPILNRIVRIDDRKLDRNPGVVSGFLMGAAFAFGWSPCAGPVLGGVLTYTASSTSDPIVGAAYLLVYGSGIALPLLAVAWSAGAAAPLLRRLYPLLPKMERLAGLALAGTALWLLATSGLFEAAPPAGTLSADAVTPAIGEPTGRGRLVEFYRTDCPACRAMEPVVAELMRECDRQGVEVLKLNVDLPANRKVAAGYRVTAVPTFVVLGRDGRPVETLVGAVSGERLAAAASQVAGSDCRFLSAAHLPPTFETTQCSGDPLERSDTACL